MNVSAAVEARPDTQEMVIVHRVFRREFRLMPQMVRSTPAGDLARAELVAAHVSELTTALHHHHEGEDELLWPPLLERVTPRAELLERMKAEHAHVATVIIEAERLVGGWRVSAAIDLRDQLADCLEQLSTALNAHLAEEEAEVLPLAAEYLSVEEWALLGERGMASIPKNRLLVFLGYILEEASPEERASFLHHVPLPGRVAYRLIGQRQQQREARTLRSGIPQQRTG
jgi:hemerythrin-like domain-containing protein